MQDKGSKTIADNLEVLTVRSLEEIESIRPIWEEMQANEPYPKINADIARYLSVTRATPNSSQPYVMLVKENGQPEVMVIGRVEKTPVKCLIGRKTLFKPSLTQLRVVYGGILGKQQHAICVFIIGQLMKLLHRGEFDMIVFNYLSTDCPFYRVARQTIPFFCRNYFSKLEPHWCMAIPRSIDLFYESCSPRHRRNLRRYIRNLERDHPNKVKVRTYSREEELDTAINAASHISAKTYQHAFDGGIVDDTRTRILLSAAAKQGWLRLHVLYINEESAAFQTTLKYGRTYFGQEVGFDPKWSKWRVGTVLFLKVLEPLCADPTVDYYDFGFGELGYKQHYGNIHWNEASVAIFAPRPFPVFVNLVRSSTSAVSLAVEWLIVRSGIFNFVQRYRRRAMLRKAGK